MKNTLTSPATRAVLDRLFAAAALDEQAPEHWQAGVCAANATPRQRADAMSSTYMPISAAGGTLLYSLVRSSRPAIVVEFGLSFGISTIHLAAGVADNGAGRVISTELSAAKIAAARDNLAEARLSEQVTILAGDAMQTLADIAGPIGLVLLDGWKDLCLPVLKLLEPRLADGALVVADDIDLPALAPYLEYVRDPANGYVSVAFPVEDGMEISCRTGVDDVFGTA